MPGTPDGFLVPVACSPDQSSTLVCPLATVPAVVRSSRQAVFCTSAPGTSIRDCRAHDGAASAGPGRVARPVAPRVRARVASRVRERMLVMLAGAPDAVDVDGPHKPGVRV